MHSQGRLLDVFHQKPLFSTKNRKAGIVQGMVNL